MQHADSRFARTLGVVDAHALERMRDTHVLIAGVGGAGGQLAVDLTRMGFGALTLADFDVYERHNVNRQVGCFESTLGQRKIGVVARMCRDINPDVRVREVAEGVTDDNVEALLEADRDLPAPALVVEVIDLAGVHAKIALHRACRQRGLFVMTGMMLGFGAALHVFAPSAPGFDELYVGADGKLELQRMVPRLGSYLIAEYVERCLRGEGHAPTCVVGATAASALIVSETVRYVLHGASALTCWPEHVYVDYYDRIYEPATRE